MPLPATPSGVVRFKMHFEPGPDLVVHDKFDMAYTGAGNSVADLAVLAHDVSNSFGTNLKALLYSGDALFDVAAFDLQFPSLPFGTYGTSVVGTRTGTQNPNNCTAGIFFQPNVRYRGGKPKIYLPFGVAADQNNPATWTSTFVTALQSGWQAFIAGLTGQASGPYTLGAQVAVSYYQGSTSYTVGSGTKQRGKTRATPRAVPAVYPISAVVAQNTIYSQRRRLRQG